MPRRHLQSNTNLQSIYSRDRPKFRKGLALSAFVPTLISILLSTMTNSCIALSIRRCWPVVRSWSRRANDCQVSTVTLRSMAAQRRHVTQKLSLHSTITKGATEFSMNLSVDASDPRIIMEDDANAARLVETWRDHPILNPTISFPCLLVNDPSQIHAIINAPDMQEHLATRLDLLQHLHTRFKVVRDGEAKEKMILLHPDSRFDELPACVHQSCSLGPPQPISFTYSQFTAAYTLQQLLPAHTHPTPAAFETIGHVVHMNLRRQHKAYRYLIGQVLLDSLPQIKTVLIKVGEVTGPFRTYNFEIVAGENNTQVDLAEAGLRLQFDMAQVYWCSRLSEERQRMLKLFANGALIADPFCGVGALCLLAVRDKNCTVLANDWNPSAIECFQKNIKANGIDEQQIQAKCGDAYDFLTDLALNEQHPLPDHVVMNYPLEAATFLGALRWWPKDSDIVPRVHVYTFARATEDAFAEDTAVDIIASNLIAGLPTGVRRRELDEYYDCNFGLHAVRDVAPGKTVFCVSFSATPKLIKAMQGDF